MNIINKKDSNHAFFGTSNFDSTFGIISADKKFYRLIDEKQCYPFPILNVIHPTYRDRFIQLVNSLECHEVKNDAMLVQLEDKNFEWMWMILERVDAKDGKPIYSIRIFQISSLQETIREQKKIIRNYRSIMGLTENLFFEYNITTTEISIFWHSGEQDVIEIKAKLEEFKNEVVDKGYVSEKDQIAFFSLCDDLMNGRGNFYYSFANSILTKGKEEVRWIIRGSTVHERAKLSCIVGAINIEHFDGGKSDSYFEERFHIDVLTGLMNKRAITQLAESRINLNQDHKIRYVIMDIDNFKQVNDQYGHMIGDDVIVKVANIFRRMIGSHGVTGRIGGDEFFAIIEEVEQEDDLRNILKAIRLNIACAYLDSKEDINVTCSMGTVEYPTDGQTYEELFQKADYCLYLAKQKGRNRYIIYDKEKHGKVVVDKNSKGISCLEIQKTEDDKVKAYGQIIQDLYQRGYDAIIDSFAMIGQICNCEKINLYYGAQMNCVLHWGKRYPQDDKIDYINDQSYLEYFDENGVCVLDNIYITKAKKAYDHFTKQGLTSTMQVLIGDKTQIKGFLSFDRTITKARLTAMDRYNLQVISKLIGIIIENN